MIKVYTSDDRVLVHHLKNILEADGIECLVKNDQIHTLAGEVPAVECWPEVWIVEDALAGKAERLIHEHTQDATAGGTRWVCAKCGEEHEPQFSECWNCGAGKPAID